MPHRRLFFSEYDGHSTIFPSWNRFAPLFSSFMRLFTPSLTSCYVLFLHSHTFLGLIHSRFPYSPCYHFFRRRFDNWFAARYFWLPIVLNASFAAILPRVVKYHKPSPQRLAVLHLLILRDLKSSNAHTIRGHTFGDTSLVLFII